MRGWTGGSGSGRRRGVRALVGLAALLLALAGCSSRPTPSGPPDIVEFSADGPSSAAAFGTYVLVNGLLSNGARTFRGLPFRARVPVAGVVTPKMSVSAVDLPPNSRVTCRITLNGRLLVEQSGDVPGPDVVCVAPTTTG